jgi:hypothetical protein
MTKGTLLPGGTLFVIEPLYAERRRVKLVGRELIAALTAARFSVEETQYPTREAAQARAEALSERGPDGLRVVWQVRPIHKGPAS